MRLPEELRAVLTAIRPAGRPRLVGGCVRDWLLGLEPKDFDIEVAGIDFESLHRLLAPFGATNVVGRSFGVIKLRLAAGEYDFSLPRRESKTGAGHRGFAVSPDPQLSDAEASARRDFTINAIAYDPFTGTLIDPHGGQSDLRARVLRHTSPAFVEDPLRVLRAFQFAARFDYRLAPETAVLCRSISDTFAELALERVYGEWEKWATKSTKPSSGLRVLEETGWLRHFPEVAALRGTLQEPEWHPEGDVFTHTQYCLDTYYIIATAEASSNLARFDGIRYGHRSKAATDAIDIYAKSRAEGFGAEVKRRIILGTYVLSSGYYDAYYLRAQKVRTLIRQDFLTAFKDVDALLTPTSPVPAFKLGEKSDPLAMYLLDIYTIGVNLAGLPGVSVPCGFTQGGLPIGMQLIGQPFQEANLLAIARAYERAHEWHRKHPNL